VLAPSFPKSQHSLLFRWFFVHLYVFILQGIIQYLERSFGAAITVNHSEITSTVQKQTAQLKSPARSSTPPDSDSNTCAAGSEILSVGSFSDDTLEFESFYSTLDSGNHLGRPISSKSSKLPGFCWPVVDRDVSHCGTYVRGGCLSAWSGASWRSVCS
jgi:hypothetical protein